MLGNQHYRHVLRKHKTLTTDGKITTNYANSANGNEKMSDVIEEVCNKLLKRLDDGTEHVDSSKFLDEMVKLKTNLERVNVTYDRLKQYNLLPLLKHDEKDDSFAHQYRSKADKLFADHKYMEALELYTLSIARAKSKEVLALGYGNRSACLYKMKLYKECIMDIDRALVKNFYPAHLRPKLLDRRTRAEKSQSESVPERFYQDIPKIPSGRRNPTIQCARNCVEIRQNKRFGRYIAATRDIQIGEVICVEKPYAAMVRGEAYLIHCHHCLELCYNPLPCPSCVATVYCSEDCKNKAKKSYHKYQCPVVSTLISNGMEPLHVLSLKIVILAREEFDKMEEVEDPVYRSDRYKEVHNLFAATKERGGKDLFEKSLVAAFIYHLVRGHTDFFKENRMSEDAFKELLLHQLQVTAINDLSIYEDIQNKKQNDAELFGVGLYSFCSLFNHSCRPNVDKVQYGSVCVMRAMNTIPKGKQLFVTYCLQYDGLPVELRRMYLSRTFYFHCECEACEHNWMISEVEAATSPTLPEDLKMSTTEIYAWNLQLAYGNVDAARKFLQHVIPHFKKIENNEPYGNAWRIKDLMMMCYKTLGNKRRI